MNITDKICAAYVERLRRVMAERDILLGAVTMTPEIQARLDSISLNA